MDELPVKVVLSTIKSLPSMLEIPPPSLAVLFLMTVPFSIVVSLVCDRTPPPTLAAVLPEMMLPEMVSVPGPKPSVSELPTPPPLSEAVLVLIVLPVIVNWLSRLLSIPPPSAAELLLNVLFSTVITPWGAGP